MLRSGKFFATPRGKERLLLRRGHGSGRHRAPRIVPILHAFLKKGIARRRLQALLVGTELAGRHFLLRIDRKTWRSW
jgi:hypothetical protein